MANTKVVTIVTPGKEFTVNLRDAALEKIGKMMVGEEVGNVKLFEESGGKYVIHEASARAFRDGLWTIEYINEYVD